MKDAKFEGETINLEVLGRSMDVHIAVPPGPDPHPAVLLMFHRGGLDACTAHYFKEFPKAGYLTVVPNFYHHCPKDVPLHDCKKFLKDNEVIAEIAAAADYALSRPDLDRNRFFIAGHCMGGRLSFLGASTKPVFTAAVAYYGGGMMTHWGEGTPTPFELIKNIRCPVYGFFGDLDTNPSPADVDRFEAELKRYDIPMSSIVIRRPDTASRTPHATKGAMPTRLRPRTWPGPRCSRLMSAASATPDRVRAQAG